jgi:hypothetical protein
MRICLKGTPLAQYVFLYFIKVANTYFKKFFFMLSKGEALYGLFEGERGQKTLHRLRFS